MSIDFQKTLYVPYYIHGHILTGVVTVTVGWAHREQVIPSFPFPETLLYEVTNKLFCPCYDLLTSPNPLAHREALTGTKQWSDWEEWKEKILLIFPICLKIYFIANYVISFFYSSSLLLIYLNISFKKCIMQIPPIQKVAPEIMYPLPPPRLLSFLWIFAKLTGGAQFRQIAVFATLPVLKFDKLKGSPRDNKKIPIWSHICWRPKKKPDFTKKIFILTFTPKAQKYNICFFSKFSAG